MSSIPTLLAWAGGVLGTVLIIFGDLFLKHSATTGTIINRYTLMGAAAYAISAPIWAWIMVKDVSLTQIGIMFSCLVLLALPLAGMMMYQEVLTLGQRLAILLVLIAIPVSEYVK